MNKQQSCNEITDVFLLLPLWLEYIHDMGNVTAKVTLDVKHNPLLQHVTNSILIHILSWPLLMHQYWHVAVHKCQSYDDI